MIFNSDSASRASFVVLCALVSSFFAGAPLSAHAADCNAVLANLSQETNLSVLDDCKDQFWDQGKLDEFVALSYRCIDLDPNYEVDYEMINWVRLSQYVNELIAAHGAPLPDGDSKVIEAKQIYEQGAPRFKNDPTYFLDVGTTDMNIAFRNNIVEIFPVSLDAFERAETAATQAGNTALIIRARLDIGHNYRYAGQKDLAIAAYRRVLLLDPQNPVALHYIALLGG